MSTKQTMQTKPLTSWSYSRYSDYLQCPYKFKKKHLQGFKEAPSPAMARGTEIHTQAEHYLTGQIKKLPETLALFKAEMTALKKLKPTVEQQWGFDKTWAPTSWSDWNNCWLRVKLDAVVMLPKSTRLMSVDHKTGKYDEEKGEGYMEQQQLYAVASFTMYPSATEVETKLYFLDAGVTHPAEPVVYTRPQAVKLQKLWEKKVEPMFKDTRFVPRPGNHCRWCPFSKAKGGDCKY